MRKFHKASILALGAALLALPVGLHAQGPDFEGDFAQIKSVLLPNSDTRIPDALSAEGCSVLASGLLGPAHISNDKGVIHSVTSMGQLAFAKCGGANVSLLAAVKSVKGTHTLSNELRDVAPADENGISFGSQDNKKGTIRYYAAWRNDEGRQYILTLFDADSEAIAKSVLLPIAGKLSTRL